MHDRASRSSGPADPDTAPQGRGRRARAEIAIVQRYVPRYRAPFFDRLRDALRDDGIGLRLLTGRPEGAERSKVDAATVPWAEQIETRTLRLGGRELVWQSCLKAVRGTDLVIVEQAARLLVNYVLTAARAVRARPKVAMWGHGFGYHDRDAGRLESSARRLVSTHPDWWFAYTEASAASVAAAGFPRERITVVQNALDTSALVELRDELTEQELEDVRVSAGIGTRDIALFVGSLYREKRPRFLIESLMRIRELVPEFEAVVIGAGPEAGLVEDAARLHPWIHYLGPRFEREKVAMMRLARLTLMPGRVGLVAVDTFVLETPLVTVAGAAHAPEVAYVESGRNGLVLPAGTTPAEYAQAVARLLGDPAELERLRRGCREAAARYTIDEMVRRFADGVAAAVWGGRGGHRRPARSSAAS